MQNDFESNREMILYCVKIVNTGQKQGTGLRRRISRYVKMYGLYEGQYVLEFLNLLTL